jgi:hypothetical protein
VDDLARILVAMVLIGDVDVGAGMDVVSDLHVEVADDVTAAADHAPITDPDHRIGDHALARHHACRNAHVGTDQRVLPDGDPLLPEDRSGREGQTAPFTECAEPPRQ